jgi:hypothetical protein
MIKKRRKANKATIKKNTTPFLAAAILKQQDLYIH